jgi:cell division protein FtsI (penicillin-binding protein 3)
MLGSYTNVSSRIKFGLLVLTVGCGLIGAVAFASTKLSKAGASELPVASVHPVLQQIAESALLKGVTSARGDAGFAVVTDVSTGEVLAAAHVHRERGRMVADSSQSNFLKKTLNPWSVAKPLIIAEAIDKAGVNAGDIVDCGDGGYTVDGNTYQDWKPFGKISVTEIVTNSSNIGSIKIANAMGGNILAHELPEFGFGAESLASHFPNAGSGSILTAGSMSNDLLGASLAVGGSGFSVTPLEIVQAYAALANKGMLNEPRPYGQREKSVLGRPVVSEGTAQIMRSILRKVVTEGTGQKAATPSYSTAGKTGSSPHFVNFAGFAPADKARIAVYVGVENSEGDQSGGQVAAPIFSAIVEPSLRALNVPAER